jgi:hypothetical protein
MNLANRDDANLLHAAAAPAYEAWQQDLPNWLRASFLNRGVLTAESIQGAWDVCATNVGDAISWVRNLTVDRMQLALDQPDKTTTRGAKVGTRVLKRYASEAATDKCAETWYRKVAKAGRRVRTLRISAAVPSQGEMQRIEHVLWDYHVEMLRIAPTPAALSFDRQAWLLHGGARLTTTQLCSAPLDDLSAWIGFVENRHSQHRRAFVAIQRQVEAEREASAERLIARELWRHSTRRARELLMRKA